MWAATKGQGQDMAIRDKDQAGDRDCEVGGERCGQGTGANLGHHHHHGQKAFRRLVHSHGASRGVGRGAGWSQGEQAIDV